MHQSEMFDKGFWKFKAITNLNSLIINKNVNNISGMGMCIYAHEMYVEWYVIFFRPLAHVNLFLHHKKGVLLYLVVTSHKLLLMKLQMYHDSRFCWM